MAKRNYLPQFMVRAKIYSSDVRKPPGDHTNDIFGLEQRQYERKLAIDADKRMVNIVSHEDKFHKKCFETMDIPSPRTISGRKLRRSMSEGRTDRAFRTPPVAVGKENIGTHFKSSLSPASKISSGDKKLDDESEESDGEIAASKEEQGRNPITGDGLDDSSTRSKLEGVTNIAKEETPTVHCPTPWQPCIRVRQPPGGTSSIMFY